VANVQVVKSGYAQKTEGKTAERRGSSENEQEFASGRLESGPALEGQAGTENDPGHYRIRPETDAPLDRVREARNREESPSFPNAETHVRHAGHIRADVASLPSSMVLSPEREARSFGP
jgi:hypothetical protein